MRARRLYLHVIQSFWFNFPLNEDTPFKKAIICQTGVCFLFFFFSPISSGWFFWFHCFFHRFCSHPMGSGCPWLPEAEGRQLVIPAAFQLARALGIRWGSGGDPVPGRASVEMKKMQRNRQQACGEIWWNMVKWHQNTNFSGVLTTKLFFIMNIIGLK